MKYKLDDIEKKQSFKVPERYFEDLPLQIQTRIQKPIKKNTLALFSWQYASAASLVLFLVTYFILTTNNSSPETLLAEVSQEELIAYLDNMDLNLEDLTTTFQESSEDLDFTDLDGMEELDMDEEKLEDLLLEYDINEDYL